MLIRLGSTVDAAPARKRIRYLLQQGASQRAIAAAAGTSHLTVWSIVRGRRQRIYPDLESAILALKPSQCKSRLQVDPKPTLQILDELTESGYSRRQLAKWLGYSRQTVGRNQHNPCVTQRFVEAVHVLRSKLERGELRRD